MGFTALFRGSFSLSFSWSWLTGLRFQAALATVRLEEEARIAGWPI